MAKFAKKLNPLVSRQLPEHIQANSPLLVDFIKQYYEFMDSAQITLLETLFFKQYQMIWMTM
jgi:hypothetical protein